MKHTKDVKKQLVRASFARVDQDMKGCEVLLASGRSSSKTFGCVKSIRDGRDRLSEQIAEMG